MIQPKKKKCKGTGKAKGYGCGDETYHRVYGLCKQKCYPDWLLNSEQGKIMLEKATLKATKPRRELEKAESEHNNRKGITTLLKSLKEVCHKYIRLRDEGKPCISCGTPWKSDFDAGHFYKSELYSNLRFNEHNIHGQCIQCNRREEGNLSQYLVNLPKRIGEWKFNLLKSEAENYKQQDFKWDREHLKKLKSYYTKKIKELNK